MMKHLQFTLLFSLIASCSLAQTYYSRSRQVDVQHISLDLVIDWQGKRVVGTATILMTPLFPIDSVKLDGAALQIRAIKMQDQKLSYTYDGSDRDNSLVVALPSTYGPGKSIALTIEYNSTWVNLIDPNSLSGSNGKGLRFSAPTFNDPVKPKEVWSMAEPQGNRFWFPGVDDPGDWRTTLITVTTESTLSVLSNGDMVFDRNNGNGTHTVQWKMDQPYANHLTSLVVGEYVDVPASANEVSLHSYSYPREVAATAASVERLPDMLKFFSERTGVNYPYKRYSQVFVQDIPWGVGTAMVATQSENMVDDQATHDDFLYLWDGLEGEMLASQWFAVRTGFGEWRDAWLSRALPHYFDGLYSEYKNGKEEFQLWHRLGGDMNGYLWEWNAGVRHPVVTGQFDNPASFLSYDSHTTTKGALILHMLRKHLGDDLWWKGIRLYITRHAGKPASTEDFRRAFAEVSGDPLDWFFEQWVYRYGHPVFEMTKSFDAQTKRLLLEVKQLQKPDSASNGNQTQFFQGFMDVEIDSELKRIWIKPQELNRVSIPVDHVPGFVNVDYEGTWIAEFKVEKPTAELLLQLKRSSDVYSRREALMQLSAIGKKAETTASEKSTILDALRSVALDESIYWRFRLQVLTQINSLISKPGEVLKPDQATLNMLLKLVQTKHPWLKTSAITILGNAKSAEYDKIFIAGIKDRSDRVVNASAVALGKSKSKRAFNELSKLPARPSWKNQSLMSALGGLKELGDSRGYDIAYKSLAETSLLRWRLPTPPVWDYRVVAVETIKSLGKSADVYPLLKSRLDKCISDNDLEGIFNNLLLISKLDVPDAQRAFDVSKEFYAKDEPRLESVKVLESEFQQLLSVKK